MAEQSNGLPEACGTKRFLETEMFMRTGKCATHHGSEHCSIQKPHTFAQTISTLHASSTCSHAADHTFVPVGLLV
jgi:hypothetical protein